MPIAAVFVVVRRAGGDIEVPVSRIDTDRRPRVAAATVLPGVAGPGVVAEFAGLVDTYIANLKKALA